MEDFADIHRLLESNKICKPDIAPRRDLGDVLITGATGWLGIHVLDEFLSSESGTAVCLVRGVDLSESRKRLNETLERYFGGKHARCGRIVVLCGDVTDRLAVNQPIGTVIHCAASVKHYGSYQYSHNVNVLGTKNVIELAKEKGAKLLHVSTSSISGNGFGLAADFPPATFDESSLFIGQSLENVYVRSKFEAEVAVFQARLNGAEAEVVRVGNLSNRSSDFKFQQNYQENATLAKLKAFVHLGLYPKSMADFPIEFSPVDFTAKAIIKIAQHHDEARSVFHAYNHHTISFSEFVNALHRVGIKMEPVPLGDFMQAVSQAGKSPQKAHIHETLIHDIGSGGTLDLKSSIALNSDSTVLYLAKMGFDWHNIGDDYLEGYIRHFIDIGYL